MERTHAQIDNFVSEKKLKHLNEIIEISNGDVDLAYERIESFLEDDFKVLSLGTNRIVFTSRKDKFDKYVFKVAGDQHGKEANLREFYNGDLDKRLTFTYSVDKNGIFSVQEKVTVMSDDRMKESKKDVRDMLEHLSKKILLVDCKIQNFKNFGFRKNGDVVLLDHGDTVPLVKFQGNDIVNIDEESYVSLICKKYKADDAAKPKLCGGKLSYTKNYDALVCEKCGVTMPVTDAYRESDLASRLGRKESNNGVQLDSSFYEWKENLNKIIKSYVSEQMDSIGNKNNIEEENNDMKHKLINGEECENIRGYWIPLRLTRAPYAMSCALVRQGQLNPSKFLSDNNLSLDEYKVFKSDHLEYKDEPSQDDVSVEKIARSIIEEMNKSQTQELKIPFDKFGVTSENIKKVFYAMKETGVDRRIKYDLENQEFIATKDEALRNKIKPPKPEQDIDKIIDDAFEDLGSQKAIPVNEVSDEGNTESKNEIKNALEMYAKFAEDEKHAKSEFESLSDKEKDDLKSEIIAKGSIGNDGYGLLEISKLNKYSDESDRFVLEIVRLALGDKWSAVPDLKGIEICDKEYAEVASIRKSMKDLGIELFGRILRIIESPNPEIDSFYLAVMDIARFVKDSVESRDIEPDTAFVKAIEEYENALNDCIDEYSKKPLAFEYHDRDNSMEKFIADAYNICMRAIPKFMHPDAAASDEDIVTSDEMKKIILDGDFAFDYEIGECHYTNDTMASAIATMINGYSTEDILADLGKNIDDTEEEVSDDDDDEDTNRSTELDSLVVKNNESDEEDDDEEEEDVQDYDDFIKTSLSSEDFKKFNSNEFDNELADKQRVFNMIDALESGIEDITNELEDMKKRLAVLKALIQ